MEDRQKVSRFSRDHADRIARVMHLKKSRQGVRAKNKNIFEKIIFEFVNEEVSGHQTVKRIQGLHYSIPERFRNIEIFKLVLMYLWLVPPKSELERELVQLANQCYSFITNPGQRRGARAELKKALKSTFYNVRHFAIKIKSSESVKPKELSSLMDPMVFRDVQGSIAVRIIEHQQFDLTTNLFDYITHLCSDKEYYAHLDRLLHLLRSWPPEAEYLKRLFDCYLEDSYAVSDTKGLIMRNLTENGLTLTPALAHLYQEESDKRDAIINLFSHMVSYGQLPALKTMLTLYESSLSSKIQEKLLHGLRKLSNKKNAHGTEIWSHLTEWMDINRGKSKLDPLLQTLSQIRERVVLSEQELEDLISGSNRFIWKLRHTKQESFDQLKGIALDTTRPPAHRIKAVTLINETNVSKFSKHNLLVSLLDAPQPSIKRAVILGLASLEMNKQNESLRETIYSLFNDPQLGLKKVIQDNWSKLFSEVLPQTSRGLK